MIKIPKDQYEFLKQIMNGLDNSLPTDFYSKEELIELLSFQGKYDTFRSSEYNGNSSDFIEDCILSLTARPGNEGLFRYFYSTLISIKDRAVVIEYYELAMNLATMIDHLSQMYCALENR